MSKIDLLYTLTLGGVVGFLIGIVIESRRVEEIRQIYLKKENCKMSGIPKKYRVCGNCRNAHNFMAHNSLVCFGKEGVCEVARYNYCDKWVNMMFNRDNTGYYPKAIEFCCKSCESCKNLKSKLKKQKQRSAKAYEKLQQELIYHKAKEKGLNCKSCNSYRFLNDTEIAGCSLHRSYCLSYTGKNHDIMKDLHICKAFDQLTKYI